MKMRALWLALFVVCVACVTPKSPQAALADSEIALTSAVQTADNYLASQCQDAHSDACGKALTWHVTMHARAEAASSLLKAAHTSLDINDPAAMQSALSTANSLIAQINSMVNAKLTKEVK